MNRRFHLYPENTEQQRLRLSASLVDIHQRQGFDEVIAPFDISLEEVAADEKMFVQSWQELTVRPPIPQERLAAFGEALVEFARSRGLDKGGAEDVLFIDHTMSHEELLRDARERKTGQRKSVSRDELEMLFYGRILTADELEERLNRVQDELRGYIGLSQDEVDEFLADDYALIDEKRAREAGTAA